MDVLEALSAPDHKAKESDAEAVRRFLSTSKLTITPLDADSAAFAELAGYVSNSAVHDYGLVLKQAFALSDGPATVVEGGNRRLLFHGTRRCNILPVLTHGMKIHNAAVKTGKMFDSGLYFAPNASKSYNYMFGSNVLLAAEVSLVNPLELTAADPEVAAKCKGVHGGVHARGRTTVSEWRSLESNPLVKIPRGFVDGPPESTLLFDEVVIYDQQRAGLKYALVSSSLSEWRKFDTAHVKREVCLCGVLENCVRFPTAQSAKKSQGEALDP